MKQMTGSIVLAVSAVLVHMYFISFYKIFSSIHIKNNLMLYIHHSFDRYNQEM